jgi:hypothetical protein
MSISFEISITPKRSCWCPQAGGRIFFLLCRSIVVAFFATPSYGYHTFLLFQTGGICMIYARRSGPPWLPVLDAYAIARTGVVLPSYLREKERDAAKARGIYEHGSYICRIVTGKG